MRLLGRPPQWYMLTWHAHMHVDAAEVACKAELQRIYSIELYRRPPPHTPSSSYSLLLISHTSSTHPFLGPP